MWLIFDELHRASFNTSAMTKKSEIFFLSNWTDGWEGAQFSADNDEDVKIRSQIFSDVFFSNIQYNYYEKH